MEENKFPVDLMEPDPEKSPFFQQDKQTIENIPQNHLEVIPRKGNWIQSFSGGQFFPLDPKMEEINIRDIAHSLSLICRFNGHCKTMYSVAEHSIRVVDIVRKLNRRAKNSYVELYALLHDAAEAYIGDICRPTKQMLPKIKEIEDDIMKVIMDSFKLTQKTTNCDFILSKINYETIKRADDIMLATEQRDLMQRCDWNWTLSEQPDDEIIIPYSSQDAERLFIEKFYEYKHIWHYVD